MMRNILKLKSNIPRRNFLTIVNQQEVCYREFLGSNRVRLDSGVRLKLPFLHKIHRVEMREICLEVSKMKAYTSDNVPITLSGCLYYKVNDPEKACYGVVDYELNVHIVGESSMRSVIGKFTYDQIISKRNEINAELVKTIDNSISDWGVDCTKFEITEFEPQNQTVADHLQKQMEAERARRENELNTIAKIRTAEGERDSVKLKADGHAYQIEQEAHAKAQSIKLITEATSEQYKKLSEAFGNNIKPSEFLGYVVELERVKNLQEVVKSNGKVFFMDPKNTFPAQRHFNLDN